MGWDAAGTDELYTASRFTLFYLGLPAERTLVLLIFVFTPVVDSNVRQCEVRKRKKKCSLMGERILGVTMSRLLPPYLEADTNIALTHSRFQERS